MGMYKSALKMFFRFLASKNKTLLDADKHVLKDFIHYRRQQNIDQKILENNFTALSTFYMNFYVFEEYANVNPVLPVRKRYLRAYKEEDDNNYSFDEFARKQENKTKRQARVKKLPDEQIRQFVQDGKNTYTRWEQEHSILLDAILCRPQKPKDAEKS